MASEREETTPDRTYELTCTDCTYETTVDGNVHDALDAARLHQETHGDAATGHFVDFERSDRSE